MELSELPQADFISIDDSKPAQPEKAPEETSSIDSPENKQAALPSSIRLFAGNFRSARLLGKLSDD